MRPPLAVGGLLQPPRVAPSVTGMTAAGDVCGSCRPGPSPATAAESSAYLSPTQVVASHGASGPCRRPGCAVSPAATGARGGRRCWPNRHSGPVRRGCLTLTSFAVGFLRSHLISYCRCLNSTLASGELWRLVSFPQICGNWVCRSGLVALDHSLPLPLLCRRLQQFAHLQRNHRTLPQGWDGVALGGCPKIVS
jgi:hypothetical protein